MQKIQIIHEPTSAEPFVVINKPRYLPSAPLTASDEENAFFQAAEFFPELLKVSGKKEIEHGLVHRLDTETSGLLLIASSQYFYDKLQEEQKEERFIKKYTAFCNEIKNNCELLKGFPPFEEIIDFNSRKSIEVLSYFRPFSEGLKEVRPVTEKSGMAALKKCRNKKLYSTEITPENYDEQSDLFKFTCKIYSGYRHQVRCHLAWCGFPVSGDKLYNSKSSEEELKFFATEIEFTNPIDGKNCVFKIK